MKNKKINKLMNRFVIDELDFCGCYTEEVITDIIKVFLRLLTSKEKEPEKRRTYITDICEDLKLEYKYVHLILNLLDKLGWTEHGTVVRGCWIDDKGMKVMEKYKLLFDKISEEIKI